MNFYKNNYYQSDEFRNLNELIFKNKIINIDKNRFFILRNSLHHNLKESIKIKSIGTEFRGILEFFGQPININSENVQKDFLEFINTTLEIIKKYNPGVVVLRNFELDTEKNFKKFSEYLINRGFQCRIWNSLLVNIRDIDNSIITSHYNTRREINLIKNLNVEIEKIENFDQYQRYLNFFFNSIGHEDYPNKNIYYNKNTWNNLRQNHHFFILKINQIEYSIFGVRLYKERAYWCMVGRIRKFKYSLHAYAISF